MKTFGHPILRGWIRSQQPSPTPTPTQENADSAKSRRACGLSAANSLLTACHVSSLAEGQRSSVVGGVRIIRLVSTEVEKAGMSSGGWVCRGREVGEAPAACQGWKSSLILLSPGGDAGGWGVEERGWRDVRTVCRILYLPLDSRGSSLALLIMQRKLHRSPNKKSAFSLLFTATYKKLSPLPMLSLQKLPWWRRQEVAQQLTKGVGPLVTSERADFISGGVGAVSTR